MSTTKFQKGKSGNEKGRPKDSKNKTNKAVREMFESLLSENLEDLKKVFDTLKETDPSAYVKHTIEIAKLVYPRGLPQDEQEGQVIEISIY